MRLFSLEYCATLGLTKEFIFYGISGGHLWASPRNFSSIKPRRAAGGTPAILSTRNYADLLQIWLAGYAKNMNSLVISGGWPW